MNAFVVLIGTLTIQGRYMLARDLLADSEEAQRALSQYLVMRKDRLAGCDLITVAAVYVRDMKLV